MHMCAHTCVIFLTMWAHKHMHGIVCAHMCVVCTYTDLCVHMLYRMHTHVALALQGHATCAHVCACMYMLCTWFVCVQTCVAVCSRMHVCVCPCVISESSILGTENM